MRKKNGAYTFKRAYVIARDHQRCVWCGGRDDLTIHHLRPAFIGGTTQVPNLITLCRSCHERMEQRITRFVILLRSGVIWLVYGPLLRLARLRNDVQEWLQQCRD